MSGRSQTVGDLRTLVARRVGVKKRVALLSGDAALVAALEGNQCTVLVDPDSLEAVEAFRPECVVGFDGLLSEGPKGLEGLRRVAPDAEVVLSFANAASASVVVQAATGGDVHAAWSEASVRDWLRSCGYVVASRDVVLGGHQPSALSADVEASLRQWLEQVNPHAAADRFLVVARRGVEASPVAREAGLTSVVVCGDDVAQLEGTVRSVVGQLHRPLEVVVVSAASEAVLEDVTKHAKGRAGVTLRLLGGVAGDGAKQNNHGLAQAAGQYVCGLQAGELLEREHLGALVKALESGTRAWALSAPPLEPMAAAPFELRSWLDAGVVHRGRWLADRDRLGAFALELAEGEVHAEAMLFARLAAVFPVARAGQRPTFDSQRVLPPATAHVLGLLKARSLQVFTPLSKQLESPAPVDLAAEVQARLEASSPLGASVFKKARELTARVKDAAEQARAEAARRR